MVLIYTPRINARVTYITRYLFTAILGVPVNLTINAEEFKQYEGPQINYSNEMALGFKRIYFAFKLEGVRLNVNSMVGLHFASVFFLQYFAYFYILISNK
jgi:hypothetical protein